MPKTIIIGFDGSERGEQACVLGGDLATLTDAPVRIVHIIPQVFPDSAIHPSHYEWSPEQQAEAGFDHAEELVGAVPEISRDVVLARSTPAGLHWLAEQDDARVIVVGSSHRGAVGRLTVGSVGERLLYGAPCAVAVAPHGFEGFSRGVIGVAFDGSEESRLALGFATELAQRSGDAIRLVAVYDDGIELPRARAASGGGAFPRKIRSDLHSATESAVAGLSDTFDAAPILVDGDPATELTKQSQGFDALFCGSRSYGPLRTALLGGVSRLLVRNAPCPVIVTPRPAGD
jgi:nucleotide-binding universal stress UspA family protein